MSDTPHILVVEDDERLAALIKDYLQKQGFVIQIEDRGDTAIERIRMENPDLVILDLMLPGKDGLAVCQSVRNDYHGPILILTAREDDMDQVAGLEMGADDYVKKPVEPRVLLARIRALLRRLEKLQGEPDPEIISKGKIEELVFGELCIRKTSHSAFLSGKTVELTTNEFGLLWYLASNSGEVLSRETLYHQLRGIEYDGLDRSMDVMVSRLRKKLGDDSAAPRRIKTIWGQGYLFVEDAWEK
ncbi:MAG: response regulator [Desulfocapsaceae bacterium]|nr:response regulator [Desulfocapsaceae bacterium]